MELTSIKDVVIGSCVEIRLQFFFRWSDEHIVHEQCVVGSGTDNSDFNSEVLVPSGIPIQDVQLNE